MRFLTSKKFWIPVAVIVFVLSFLTAYGAYRDRVVLYFQERREARLRLVGRTFLSAAFLTLVGRRGRFGFAGPPAFSPGWVLRREVRFFLEGARTAVDTFVARFCIAAESFLERARIAAA